jgi:hypothetical protein
MLKRGISVLSRGAQCQAQPASGHGSSKGSVDLSSILTNMLTLFQQFLETVGNKVESGQDQAPAVNNAKIEQAREREMPKIEEKVPVKDIPESSAQGEARGVTQNSGPYCYHCLTCGHPKEGCSLIFVKVCLISKVVVLFSKKLRVLMP